MQATVEISKTRADEAVASPNKRAIFYAFEDCQHAIFYNVGWAVYEEMLERYDGIRNPRLYYDRGVLEIIPNSSEHEIPIFSLFTLIDLFADEMKLDVLCIGQSTLRRKSSRRGFEPDSSYYFDAKAAIMRGKDRVDLQIDPTPDLVVEVDITNPSTDKLALFAAVGIPEVWVFEKKKLKILRLRKNSYREVGASVLLPDMTSAIVTEFVYASREMKSFEWREKV